VSGGWFGYCAYFWISEIAEKLVLDQRGKDLGNSATWAQGKQKAKKVEQEENVPAQLPPFANKCGIRVSSN
jgi:hypothetical protein